MSWNTHQLGKGAEMHQNEVVQYLLQQEADVICLQEVELVKYGDGVTLPEFRNALRSKYWYTYYDFKIYNDKRQFGNVVFSRYPLQNKHTLRYPSKGNISSCCDVIVPRSDGEGSDTIRLMVNHLESNRLIPEDIGDSLDLGDLKRVYRKFRDAERKRTEQAEVVHQAVHDSPYPVLVVGDMNTIPHSPSYRKLISGLRDGFRELHPFRWGGTCSFMGFWVRIDYIFADRRMTVRRCWVDGDAEGSDHLPIWSEVTW